MSVARTELQESILRKEAAIAELEPLLDQAKAETKEAARALNVQLRYSSRLQNAISQSPPVDAFGKSMVALIEADKVALEAKGK